MQTGFLNIQDAEENNASRTSLYDDETRIELGLVGDSVMSKEDLLNSSHNLSFLASLYTSIVSINTLAALL